MVPSVAYKIYLRKLKSGPNITLLNPSTLNYQVYLYNQLKKSPKDIYPHWGQSIDVTYQYSMGLTKFLSQTTAQARLYFPGIFRHQGFSVYAGYEYQPESGFENQIPVPRGYSGLYFTNYYTIRSNYVFPVAYPDWNLQGASYLKRIYANIFYDYMKSQQPTGNQFSSTGLAVFTDWNFLSLFPDVSLGLRWNYKNNQKSSTFDFLVNVTF